MRWFNKHTNKGAPAIEVGIGDKVVITANTYNLPCSDGTLGLFNGEVGIIIEISELEEIVIDFGDRVCRVPHVVQAEYNNNVYLSYPHRSIDLAYALTTHKCQGSEFKHVAYMIDRSVFRMLNRKNLYTAITRARESVSIIFSKDALVLAVTKRE
jgi:exodeoxyribonuclease V alpha subunit